MKILLYLLLMLLIFPITVQADPWLASDPHPFGVGKLYEREENGELILGANSCEADGSIWHNLRDIPPGERTYRLRYVGNWEADVMDGTIQEYGGWSNPFWLKRPDVSQVPSGQKLVPSK